MRSADGGRAVQRDRAAAAVQRVGVAVRVEQFEEPGRVAVGGREGDHVPDPAVQFEREGLEHLAQPRRVDRVGLLPAARGREAVATVGAVDDPVDLQIGQEPVDGGLRHPGLARELRDADRIAVQGQFAKQQDEFRGDPARGRLGIAHGGTSWVVNR